MIGVEHLAYAKRWQMLAIIPVGLATYGVAVLSLLILGSVAP